MPRFRIAGPVGFEGLPTGDGRMIERGALRFAESMPLLFVRESRGGHDGAVVVGHFTHMVRDGDTILADGEFIDPEGVPQELADDIRTAMLLVAEGHAPGVSFDLGEVTAELRVAANLFEDEAMGLPEPDEEGRITIAEISPNDQIMVFTDALVRGATLVAIPAFSNALLEVFNEDGMRVDGAEIRSQMSISASIEPEMDENGLISVETLLGEPETAENGLDLAEILAEDCACTITAAAPRQTPAAAFERVEMDAPTPLTVEDGRIYGHIALWGTCHIGMPGVCTTPPNDPTGEYRAFHQSRLQTDAGVLNVGVLTVGGGHADPRLGARAAAEHYDEVGTAFAYVRAYEDEHGIAVVGVLADDLDERTLATALAHPVSGDWRNLGAGLELVAVCSVNTPGFPVLAASADLGQTALVASSAPVAEEEEILTNPLLSDDLAKAIVDEMERRQAERELEAEVAALLDDVKDSLDLEAERIAREVGA